MIDKIELGKCWWCGSDAEMLTNGVVYWVVGIPPECDEQTNRYPTGEQAIEAWNKRAGESDD